jgi:hypothetical protein
MQLNRQSIGTRRAVSCDVDRMIVAGQRAYESEFQQVADVAAILIVH